MNMIYDFKLYSTDNNETIKKFDYSIEIADVKKFIECIGLQYYVLTGQAAIDLLVL